MKYNLTRLLPSDRTLKRLAPWLLIAIALLMLLPGTFSLPLIDRDEPRFAQASVEMMHRNDWVIPWFNGEYRFDKPPLSYWMMRGSYSLFGVNEFGARFHSIVCAIALALLLYRTGRRWFSEKAGFLAGFFSLTAMQTLIHGRSCVADMPMIVAVAVTCIAIYELLSRTEDQKYPWGWFWALHLSLSVGFLAKGPIAWAVPFLALLLLRFAFYRKPLAWKNLKIFTGLPIVLIPLAAWGIPALIQTHGAFWDVGMGEHVVERGYSVFNSRKFIPGYYIPMALVSLFPWIAFLGMVWRLFRSEKQSLLIRWLAAWFIAPYLIFSFYLTQLPHYVMPGFAAFFLLLAEAFCSNRDMPGWGKILKKTIIVIGITTGAAALLGGLFIPLDPAVQGLKQCLIGFGASMLGLTGLLSASRRRTLLALLLAGAGFIGIGHGLRSCVPGPALQPLFQSMPEDTTFAFKGYTEGNLIFYSDRIWENCHDAQEFLSGSGPRLLVISEYQMKLEDFIKREPPKDLSDELNALDVPGYSMTRFKGFNPARSSLMTLRIYYRDH
jgi:4-amino-4-deoxy-L-arabinose transferase-like glycosyltransferase